MTTLPTGTVTFLFTDIVRELVLAGFGLRDWGKARTD